MTIKEWIDNFGDSLSEILEEKGMTQRDLAKDACLPISSVNAYIRKQSPPGIKAIINMAYALDMSVDELIDFGERIE